MTNVTRIELWYFLGDLASPEPTARIAKAERIEPNVAESI